MEMEGEADRRCTGDEPPILGDEGEMNGAEIA